MTRYRIVFEIIAYPDAPPAPVRLRRLLKTALRRDGLRCVSACEEASPIPDAPPDIARAARELAKEDME